MRCGWINTERGADPATRSRFYRGRSEGFVSQRKQTTYCHSQPTQIFKLNVFDTSNFSVELRFWVTGKSSCEPQKANISQLNKNLSFVTHSCHEKMSCFNSATQCRSFEHKLIKHAVTQRSLLPVRSGRAELNPESNCLEQVTHAFPPTTSFLLLHHRFFLCPEC